MGRPKATMTPAIRFWKSVEKTPTCWNWTGAKTKRNRPTDVVYGTFKVKDKRRAAHRVSYEMHRGPIPTGLNVCHTCDNGICVNPDHLFTGTQKQNMEDCSRKGRIGHSSHLTEHDVRTIRAEYKPHTRKGPGSGTELRERFRLSSGGLSEIINRNRWRIINRNRWRNVA